MPSRTRAEAIDFELRLDDWPRRLLKVEREKLISCEWQEGNVYGGVKCPPYVAISYTWGRYELRENEHMEVAAIDIRGEDGLQVPWKIPRIDPSKFTTHQFVTLLRRITIGPKLAYFEDSTATFSFLEIDDFSKKTQVQFVWLDIACIDQREGSPEKVLEIGRQAVIFKGSYLTYVWLYHHEPCFFKQVLSSIDEAYHIGVALPSIWNCHFDRDPLTQAEIDWLPNTVRNLEILDEEPYFSSLWTLQEAFLCSQARIMMKNAHMLIQVQKIAAYSRTGKDLILHSARTIEDLGSTLGRLVSQISINR